MDAAQIRPSRVNGSQPRRHSRLAARGHQFVRVPIRDDRADDLERRRDPDKPIRHQRNSESSVATTGSSSPRPAARSSATVRAVIA